MYLVQLLLPITDSASAFDSVHTELKKELTARFGGVTAYSRAPAHGAWKPDEGAEQHDDVVLIEVVTDQLEAEWWRSLRHRLERDLEQESVLIRAMEIQML